MTKLSGFYIERDNSIIGLITFRILNNLCEIISLDSLNEHQGIGSRLLSQVVNTAIEHSCSAVTLITTNDNLNALQFYQKRGFALSKLYCNSLENSRKLKPEIPTIGENGIPLRDELELTLNL